jgi:hypothetical protein
MSVATETPRPPRELEPALPKALSELIVSLLSKDPADRPASALAVAEALDHIAQEVVRPAKKNRKWWLVAGTAVTLVSVLLARRTAGGRRRGNGEVAALASPVASKPPNLRDSFEEAARFAPTSVCLCLKYPADSSVAGFWRRPAFAGPPICGP